MLQITYSKGVYTLTDGTKTYTFNINNGHLINTKTNRQVCRPSFAKTDIYSVLRREYQNNKFDAYANMLTALYVLFDSCAFTEMFSNANFLTRLRAIDKLLNVVPKGYRLTSPYGLEDLSKKQLVKVINVVREYNNLTNKRIDIQAIIKRIETEELATAHGLPIEFVEKHKDALHTFDEMGEEYQDIALYYFYNQKLYALRTSKDKRFGGSYGATYIRTYIHCCQAMNKQPIKTNNFMREYIETLMAYDIWVENKQNERFLSQYERYKDNLTFNYGNYTIVLPTKSQDLVTEGNEMHHCVGSYIEKVANGDTLIVFVRHKDTPNQCYITAEINPSSGKIGQYYLAYDRSINTTEDKEFKIALQEWLKSCKW